MAIINTLDQLKSIYDKSVAPSAAPSEYNGWQSGMSFAQWLQNIGAQDMGGGNYQIPDSARQGDTGLLGMASNFMESSAAPLALFGGGLLAAGALGGAAAGAGDWASMGGGVDPSSFALGGETAGSATLGTPMTNNFLSDQAWNSADWATQGGGVDPGTTVFGDAASGGGLSPYADWASQGGGVDPSSTALGGSIPGITGGGTDWLNLAGKALPGLAQAAGNYFSGESIKDLASQQKSQFDQFQAMGAPYRQRLSDLYANPNSFLSSPEVQVPVQQGTDALARSLSAKVGNPIGNMTALQDIQNYSANQLYGKLGQEKDRLGGFGGLSAYNQAGAGAPLATQLSQAGIGADAGVWGGLGRAAGDVLNPAPTTLADLLKMMQGNNMFTVKGA